LRTFLEFLKNNPGSALQLVLDGENGAGVNKFVDVLEFDEFGITVANRAGGTMKLVEAYPWSAVRGLVTTFSSEAIFPA
jgi:hypothetical protein